MKLFKFGLMAAACAMMASCSSEEPMNNSNNTVSGETGYATFSINLPTVSGSGSRAETDVRDAEGLASEYAVANGKVFIFKKAATEGDATYVCSADLNGMTWGNAAAGEITVKGKAVAELTNIDKQNASVQYGALVILNAPAELVQPGANEKLSSWIAKEYSTTMTCNMGGVTYLTMSSAAKYDGNKQPVLLVDVNKDKLYQTETQAMADSEAAATVFVQRNVAKVTLTTSDNYGHITEGTYAGDEVTIDAWGLDVTNKKSYAFQNVYGLADSYADIWKGGNSLNRFFGNGTQFQRTFWAKDPNYNKDITTLDQVKAEFNVINTVTEKPAQAYALENTFDIDHQMQGQTTRVVLKATYKPKGIGEGNFYKLGSSSTIWSSSTLTAQIIATAQTVVNSQNVTIDGAAIKTAGYHSLNEVVINKDGAAITAEQKDLVAKRLGLTDAAAKEIATYADGKSYYVARVKHFGDADCPWTLGDPTYGGDNLKYLGRYGMVRNNWYEVNVNSISNPGSPVVPEINPEEPDDESSYFISVSVNILSWAKRVQGVDL